MNKKTKNLITGAIVGGVVSYLAVDAIQYFNARARNQTKSTGIFQYSGITKLPSQEKSQVITI